MAILKSGWILFVQALQNVLMVGVFVNKASKEIKCENECTELLCSFSFQ